MDKSKHTILVVDDVVDNVTIVDMILRKEGYKVITANDGATAIKLAQTESIDLILLDIMMAELSGLEVCRHLKIEPQTASIPVIFLTASDDRKMLSLAYKVGGRDYIRKPFFKDELLARVHNSILLRDSEKHLESKIIEKTKDIAETQVEVMNILGGVAEGHSKETYAHVKRVTQFTYLLATLCDEISEEEAIFLRDASSLHDVGKISIRESILHKQGKLTNQEFKIMKKHVDFGVEMLEKSKLPLFQTAAIAAGQHHEKYDGSGYPKGLKGEKIHIYGRIVAIADVFDALSHKRAYKDSWSIEDVLGYMKDMSGKHFDPRLIDIFFKNIKDFLAICEIHNQEIEVNKKMHSTTKNKIMQWLSQYI